MRPRWQPSPTGPPDVETDAGLVERVATGDAGHEEVMAWISQRTREKEMRARHLLN